MVVVLMTITVNYILAIGCGDACYPESDTPIDFPDHLFISTTLQKPPTRVIGLVGFSLASLTGVMMGLARCLQIHSLTECIQTQTVQENLRRKNRASVKYLLIFGISLVLLTVFPPQENKSSAQTAIHYFCSFLTFATFLVFVIVQLHQIEGTLVTLPAHPPSENDVEIPFLSTDTL